MLNRITNEDSYAVRAITQMLNGSSNGLAHRDIIWKNAINEIIKNPILGLGVGGYQAKYALYPHNIFLDMYLSFGIFSLIFIKKIFNKALAVLKKPNIFLVYILIMGILPLMFNNTFMAWKYFWIMILFLYRGGDSNEKIINNNTNV